MDPLNLAPIVIFVYNRPWHTEQTLEALSKNELVNQSTLYIMADGAKEHAKKKDLQKIADVRSIIRKKKWCKEVVIEEKEKNQGLADSIINGVTRIINKHEKIIVLEDDLVVAPGFLKYMNQALQILEPEKKVMHISSFIPKTTNQFRLPDYFFTRYMNCWGWATWKDRWDKALWNATALQEEIIKRNQVKTFSYYGTDPNLYDQLVDNMDGNLKTWAIKWYATVFLENGLVLTPKYSFIENIGLDYSGTHCTSFERNKLKVNVEKSDKLPDVSNLKIQESQKARIYLKRFFRYGNKSDLLHRIKMNYYWHILKSLKRG